MDSMELMLHTQEIALNYINKLKRLSNRGDALGQEARKLLNEMQLIIAGVESVEKVQ